MNQNDTQGAGDTAHQDAAEADTLDDRSAQDRKAQIAEMLAREQNPEHQARVAKADLAFARQTKAEEKLNRREKKLNDNPANMDAAEADVTFAQKELRDLDLDIEELRGDFHMPSEESCDDPPPTILHWIELDEGTDRVEFQNLPLLLAKAQAKPGEEGTTIAVRAIQFESELDLLVDRELVPLTNPLSGEPHEYPHGYARKKTVIRIQDLHNVLARYFATGVRGKAGNEEVHAAPGDRTATKAATPRIASTGAYSTSNEPARTRKDLLTPVISSAQRECAAPFDAPAVWAVLVRMAESRTPPLMGVTDEGIKWRNANDEPRFLSLRNLRERLWRMKRKAR